MRLTVDLPWFTYTRRLAVGLALLLVLLAMTLPASAAPPQGVSGEVVVINDETNPVPVTVENEVAVTGGNSTPVNVSGNVTVGNTDPVPVEDAARAEGDTGGMTLSDGASQNSSTFNVVSAVTVSSTGRVFVSIEDSDADNEFNFWVGADETFSQVFPVPLWDVQDITVSCLSSGGCSVILAVAGWNE